MVRLMKNNYGEPLTLSEARLVVLSLFLFLRDGGDLDHEHMSDQGHLHPSEVLYGGRSMYRRDSSVTLDTSGSTESHYSLAMHIEREQDANNAIDDWLDSPLGVDRLYTELPPSVVLELAVERLGDMEEEARDKDLG